MHDTENFDTRVKLYMHTSRLVNREHKRHNVATEIYSNRMPPALFIVRERTCAHICRRFAYPPTARHLSAHTPQVASARRRARHSSRASHRAIPTCFASGRAIPSLQRPWCAIPSLQQPWCAIPSLQRPSREIPSSQRPWREIPSLQRPGRAIPS